MAHSVVASGSRLKYIGTFSSICLIASPIASVLPASMAGSPKPKYFTRLSSVEKHRYRKMGKRLKLAKATIRLTNKRLRSALTKLDTVRHIVKIATDQDKELKEYQEIVVKSMEGEPTDSESESKEGADKEEDLPGEIEEEDLPGEIEDEDKEGDLAGEID